MKYNIEFVNTSVNDKLEAITSDKLESLKEKYQHIIKASVFFKHEKKDPIRGKICEIRLSLPGPLIFASSNEDTFEKAIIETVNDLSIQLKKQKAMFKAKDTMTFKSA